MFIHDIRDIVFNLSDHEIIYNYLDSEQNPIIPDHIDISDYNRKVMLNLIHKRKTEIFS